MALFSELQKGVQGSFDGRDSFTSTPTRTSKDTTITIPNSSSWGFDTLMASLPTSSDRFGVPPTLSQLHPSPRETPDFDDAGAPGWEFSSEAAKSLKT